MAKRTTPRNSTTEQNEQSAPRRTAKPRVKKADVTDAGHALATADDARNLDGELPDIPEPGDVADRAYRSMGSEPSEQDIRMRAYQRYLERGGSHGRHFDDWVEAERELRERREKAEV
jgi:DUF2934 family protein